MSADLYLHDLADTPLETYRAWRDNDAWDAQLAVLAAHGYGDLTDTPVDGLPEHVHREMLAAMDAADRRHDEAERALDIGHSEQVWIGQVSWAKAGAYGLAGGDWDDYVPPVVERLHTLFLDAPVLTCALAAEATAAFNLPNRSIYGRRTLYTDPETVAVNWAFGGDQVRRIRHGRHRMLAARSRGVEKARTVKQWLHERIGHRIYPTSQ